MNNKKKSFGIMAIALVVIIITSVFLFSNIGQGQEKKTLNDIFTYFDKGLVYSCELDLNSNKLTLELVKKEEPLKKVEKPNELNSNTSNEVTSGIVSSEVSSDTTSSEVTTEQTTSSTGGVKNNADKREKIEYYVGDTRGFIDYIQPKIIEYNIENTNNQIKYELIPIKDNSLLFSFLPMIIMVGLLVVFYFVIMRQANGGNKAMNFGKAKIKPADNKRKVTFADVAGADEEKEELEEIVDFLKNPKEFNEMGARIPKGVLLVGPPGTGKTLLAKAVSGEAGVPFFSISGSDFVEMFVGVGASRVRDLFEQAKKNAPSIIFIDEIDAVGRHRGAGLGGGHDEREQTLNQLLVEMDGFGENSGVIVIAATNRHDILDPALLRPGRFDRQVFVGYPDIKGREEILKIHTKGKPLAPDVDLKTIAKSTAGFTGADLANVANEAALLAARKKHKAITKEDFGEATIKVVVGPEKKSRVVTEKDKKLTAYHEAGHAVVTYFMPTQDPVHEVSIIPRGSAGGYTLSLPENEKSYMTKSEMKENICVLLGGRVAEKLILDDISTGASNDILRATHVARAMVTKYGFSEKLGPIVYGSDEDEVFLGKGFATNKNYSENVAAEIDSEIREIIDEAYESTKDILINNAEKLEMVAQSLLIKEKINGEVFKAIMNGDKIPTNIDENITIEDLSEKLDNEDTNNQLDSTENITPKDDKVDF